MVHQFRKPDFSGRDLELRFEDNVVCIYGTEEGLKKLANILQDLIKNPGQGHIHLESKMYGMLTKESEKGAIAIFPKK